MTGLISAVTTNNLLFVFCTAIIQLDMAILYPPPLFQKSVQMTKMLTEIGSHSLFHEYLNVLGIVNPALAKVEQLWEHKQQERLIAKIQIDKQGKARYFIDARAISVN